MPGVRYPLSEVRHHQAEALPDGGAMVSGRTRRIYPPPGAVMPVGPQCRRPVSGRLSRPVACPGSPGPYRGPDPEWRCAPGLPAPRPRGRAPHGRYPYLARWTSAKSSVPCTAACPRNTSAGQDRRCRRRTPSRGPATWSRTTSRTARPDSRGKRSSDLHPPCSAPLRDRLGRLPRELDPQTASPARGRLNNRSRSVARRRAPVHALCRMRSAEIQPGRPPDRDATLQSPAPALLCVP